MNTEQTWQEKLGSEIIEILYCWHHINPFTVADILAVIEQNKSLIGEARKPHHLDKLLKILKETPLDKRLEIAFTMSDYDNWNNGEYKGDWQLIGRLVNDAIRVYEDFIKDQSLISQKEILKDQKLWNGKDGVISQDRIGEWISVSDRLPELPPAYWKDDCLMRPVTNKCLAFDGEDVFETFYGEEGFTEKSITHWQPLPLPPTQSQSKQ